ncbi:MAG TPA: tol-pal system protein YbgF [Candidatus Acidoferrales bacterium]|nr:tol-pal system protein YbgF [Candidatus Acidoferrales bacterium]
MRAKTVVLFLAILLLGAMGGAMLAPPAADAVSREIIQIQQTVNEILQNQQDLRTDLDTKTASMQTLVQQSLDASNHLSQTMGALQKTLQDASANNGANNNSIAQQMQGVSDNMQDMQARIQKLAQQITDMQNTLQQINAHVSSSPAPQPSAGANPGAYGGQNPGGSPGTAPATPDSPTQTPVAAQQPAPSSLQPISGDTLYSNGVRDSTSGHYDLAHQEFSDYLKHFPDGPFAANAQFYLGEIAYAQGHYESAISAYDKVIVSYPRSSNVAASMLEKGRALIQTHKTASAAREFRELMRKFPGSDEARKAQSALSSISPSQ